MSRPVPTTVSEPPLRSPSGGRLPRLVVVVVAAAAAVAVAVVVLAVVATIFLPLTFVTGFFGQNFGWMTRHIDGAIAFFLLGIGLEVTAIVLLLTYFRRRDWF